MRYTVRHMSTRTLVIAAVAVWGLFAQDDEALFKDMKRIDQHAAALRKMTAKTGDEAASNAEELAKLYGSMGEYWAKKSVDDAAKWSAEGKTAATELASAAKSGDGAKADAAFKAVGGTCRSCHTAHREKLPDGTYKIK